MAREPLTSDQVETALRDLPGWVRDGDRVVRTVTAPSFRDAIALVNAVADVAEELDHHPDVDLRYRDVTFACWTHSTNGVTTSDVELARRISGVVG